MSKLRIIPVVAVSALFLALIGWGTRAGYERATDQHALLRLSWRMRGERLENCRDRTPAELEALPVHMRTPRICETTAVPYRITLRIDGGPTDTTTVLPAGAKHDRPIYVLRDVALVPGHHRVTIRSERADGKGSALEFDDELYFIGGYIELITLADPGRQLVHRSGH